MRRLINNLLTYLRNEDDIAGETMSDEAVTRELTEMKKELAKQNAILYRVDNSIDEYNRAAIEFHKLLEKKKATQLAHKNDPVRRDYYFKYCIAVKYLNVEQLARETRDTICNDVILYKLRVHDEVDLPRVYSEALASKEDSQLFNLAFYATLPQKINNDAEIIELRSMHATTTLEKQVIEETIEEEKLRVIREYKEELGIDVDRDISRFI